MMDDIGGGAMMDDIERAALDLRIARGRRYVLRRLRRRAALAGLMVSAGIVCGAHDHPLLAVLLILWSVWPIVGAMAASEMLAVGDVNPRLYEREAVR